MCPLHLPTKFTLMSATEKGQPLVKEIAELLVQDLKKNSFIKKIEIADPGFINFYLTQESRSGILKIINTQKDFKIRIGIHVGDIIKEGDDYLGSGVNIASRIHAFADPGET